MSESTAETKLMRFLLYGSEEIVYFPGCRVQYHHYLGDNLASLRTLLTNLDKQKIFDCIEFIQNGQLASHMALVPLVLSECCKVSGWKEAALEFALNVLHTDKEFLMFCKFSYEILPDIGTGPLVIKFINEWYRRRNYWELVELVSERPNCYGWCHRNVIKLAGVNFSCPLKGAAIAYANGGAELMNQLYGYDEKAKEVIEHLNRIEAFKNETNADNAIIEIEDYMHTIHTANKNLLGNKQVWKALIKQMNLVDLLAKLPTIRTSGFLRCPVRCSWDPNFVSQLCERLENVNAILESKINPCKSCVEHQRWKNKSDRFYSKSYKQKRANQDILKALKRQMDMAMEKNVKKSTKNMTIIVDCHSLSTTYCSYKRFVQADMAAAVAALYLERSAANANLVIFKGITHEYLERGMTIEDLVNNIGTDTWDCPSTREISLYLSPMNDETLETDLFVVIGANINHTEYMTNVEDHRRENPRAPKFAFCNLGGVRTDRKYKHEKDVILTSGFDDKMCDIITAFSMM